MHDYPNIFWDGSEEDFYIEPLLIISSKNIMQEKVLDFLYRIWLLEKG